MRLAATALALIAAAFAQASEPRPITLDDILTFERLADVELSPDGRALVYVMVRPGPTNVRGQSSTVWWLDLETRATRRLLGTVGDKETWGSANPQPRWSPDGKRLAYLSAETGALELWVVDVATGERRQLTRRADGDEGAIGEFVFAPSGDRIAYVRSFNDAEDQKEREKLKVVALSEQPHFLSSEGTDGSSSAYARIESVSIPAGKVERLTADLPGVSYLRWSPDGAHLAFIPSGRAWGGTRAAAADPTVLHLGTLERQTSVKTGTVEASTTWSPDGRTLAYLSHDLPTPFPWSRSRSLYTVDLDGGAPRMISGDDISVWYMLPIVWTGTPHRIYAASRERATTRVYAWAPDGSERRRVTPERWHVRDYSLSADGRRMAAIFEDANTPPEIYVGSPETGAFEQVTGLGAALDGIARSHVERVTWRSGDDRFDVEGFLVKPPGFRAGTRYPLLVNMHGGPAAVYENGFTDINFDSSYHTPAALYAAAGYLVLLPNKRGDEGYGREFLDAHLNRWGDDVEFDVLAGVDALIARGLADPDKLGVMGHSYGGYATAWAIGHTTRFKAASISDAPVNMLSYYSQAYMTNDKWMNFYFGGTPTDVQERFVTQSPIMRASRMTTPTLLRYGNRNGLIRPNAMLAQGMELFRALHEQGVPVDFVIHTAEGHTVQDEQVFRDYVARNLRWFDYWVMGKGSL